MHAEIVTEVHSWVKSEKVGLRDKFKSGLCWHDQDQDRMAHRVSGLADLPKMNAGHLIAGLTILIHHTGFIVNRQLEMWAWSMTKDHRWSSPSPSFSLGTLALCNMYSIVSFFQTALRPSACRSFSLVSRFLLTIFFKSGLLPHSKTHYQSKWEGGWKAALLCLWVDTWVNGMCTAGKMILLQTTVWIREVSLTPPTQKQ